MCALLQWSRNFSVADCVKSNMTTCLGLLLQWSRNFSVADWRTDIQRWKDGTLYFNGAATFQLRIDEYMKHANDYHGDFNGAATFQLRIVDHHVGRHRWFIYFNGAATFQLRIEWRDLIVANMTEWLQWSRNFSVADWKHLGSFHLCHCRTSMEPQLFSCGLSYTGIFRSSAKSYFNGAATFQLRIADKTNKMVGLQITSMEPQLFSCGLSDNSTYDICYKQTSMEPQLFSCGLLFKLMSINFSSLTSMEPQLFSCGLYLTAIEDYETPRTSMEPQLFSCGLM